MSAAFKDLPRTVLLGIPMLSWFAIAIILIVAIVMLRTALGRAFYAVGGNPNAAVYTGIDVGKTICRNAVRTCVLVACIVTACSWRLAHLMAASTSVYSLYVNIQGVAGG